MNDIPTKFCKLAGTTVSNFLPELFNLCIIESEYLYELKIAQIQNQRNVVSNYRPISISPPVNKMFEKTYSKTSLIWAYFETNKLLFPSQLWI